MRVLKDSDNKIKLFDHYNGGYLNLTDQQKIFLEPIRVKPAGYTFEGTSLNYFDLAQRYVNMYPEIYKFFPVTEYEKLLLHAAGKNDEWISKINANRKKALQIYAIRDVLFGYKPHQSPPPKCVEGQLKVKRSGIIEGTVEPVIDIVVGPIIGSALILPEHESKGEEILGSGENEPRLPHQTPTQRARVEEVTTGIIESFGYMVNTSFGQLSYDSNTRWEQGIAVASLQSPQDMSSSMNDYADILNNPRSPEFITREIDSAMSSNVDSNIETHFNTRGGGQKEGGTGLRKNRMISLLMGLGALSGIIQGETIDVNEVNVINPDVYNPVDISNTQYSWTDMSAEMGIQAHFGQYDIEVKFNGDGNIVSPPNVNIQQDQIQDQTQDQQEQQTQEEDIQVDQVPDSILQLLNVLHTIQNLINDGFSTGEQIQISVETPNFPPSMSDLIINWGDGLKIANKGGDGNPGFPRGSGESSENDGFGGGDWPIDGPDFGIGKMADQASCVAKIAKYIIQRKIAHRNPHIPPAIPPIECLLTWNYKYDEIKKEQQHQEEANKPSAPNEDQQQPKMSGDYDMPIQWKQWIDISSRYKAAAKKDIEDLMTSSITLYTLEKIFNDSKIPQQDVIHYFFKNYFSSAFKRAITPDDASILKEIENSYGGPFDEASRSTFIYILERIRLRVEAPVSLNEQQQVTVTDVGGVQSSVPPSAEELRYSSRTTVLKSASETSVWLKYRGVPENVLLWSELLISVIGRLEGGLSLVTDILDIKPFRSDTRVEVNKDNVPEDLENVFDSVMDVDLDNNVFRPKNIGKNDDTVGVDAKLVFTDEDLGITGGYYKMSDGSWQLLLMEGIAFSTIYALQEPAVLRKAGSISSKAVMMTFSYLVPWVQIWYTRSSEWVWSAICMTSKSAIILTSYDSDIVRSGVESFVVVPLRLIIPAMSQFIETSGTVTQYAMSQKMGSVVISSGILYYLYPAETKRAIGAGLDIAVDLMKTGVTEVARSPAFSSAIVIGIIGYLVSNTDILSSQVARKKRKR